MHHGLLEYVLVFFFILVILRQGLIDVPGVIFSVAMSGGLECKINPVREVTNM